MKTPSIRFADDFKNWDVLVKDKENKRWVFARPAGYGGVCLLWRLRMAWKVFTGQCDVLAWNAGQSKI